MVPKTMVPKFSFHFAQVAKPLSLSESAVRSVIGVERVFRLRDGQIACATSNILRTLSTHLDDLVDRQLDLSSFWGFLFFFIRQALNFTASAL